MSTVCIDLRQFTRYPYKSGVQRVLAELLRNWPRNNVDSWALVEFDERLWLVDVHEMSQILNYLFDANISHVEQLNSLKPFLEEQLLSVSKIPVTLDDCIMISDSWLLPEPTYEKDIIDSLQIVDDYIPVTAVFFDALPMKFPKHFSPRLATVTSRYLRFIVGLDKVICISKASLESLVFLNDGVLKNNWYVSYPSGEHAARNSLANGHKKTDNKYRFVTVGSDEPRKRLNLVIEGFKDFSKEFPNSELLIFGRPSRIHELHFGNNIKFIGDANDDEMFESISAASALISLSDEGFGLLCLESLALNTPIIVGGIQPALEVVTDERFVYRISTLSSSELSSCLSALVSGKENSSISLTDIQLPSWKKFSSDVFELSNDVVNY